MKHTSHCKIQNFLQNTSLLHFSVSGITWHSRLLPARSWAKWSCPPGSCLPLVQISSAVGVTHLRRRSKGASSQFKPLKKTPDCWRNKSQTSQDIQAFRLPLPHLWVLLFLIPWPHPAPSSSFPHWLLVLPAMTLPLAPLESCFPFRLFVANSCSSLEAHLGHNLHQKNSPHSPAPTPCVPTWPTALPWVL